MIKPTIQVRSQFTFRPISPEGLAGSQEDEDSEGRGLDNRLSRSPTPESGRSYSSSRLKGEMLTYFVDFLGLRAEAGALRKMFLGRQLLEPKGTLLLLQAA